MEILFVLILAVLVIGGAFALIDEAKYRTAKIKNDLVEMASTEKHHCCECKYCVYDPNNRYSDTDYFCRMSKCNYITPETKMPCFEKPKVTEDDLRELFALGIWTSNGQNYIRNSIFGEKMTFTELDAFLTKLAEEHPEYIDPEYTNKNL